MQSFLRPEDETLLADLTDELALRALFQSHTGGDADALPPHAGYWLRALRASGLPETASPLAADGKTAELAQFVERADLALLSDASVHGLAVYTDRVVARTGARQAYLRATLAWMELDARGYLSEFAVRVQAPDPGSFAERYVRERLQALGMVAQDGAPELSPRSKAALGALSDIVSLTSGDSDRVRRVRSMAQSLRDTAIDMALDPISEKLKDSLATGVPHEERAMILARAADVWTWSDGDELVERFVLDLFSDIAWELYRKNQWDDLRRALRPLAMLIESQIRRIERDPSKIAYAARCADVMFFQAEAADGVERMTIGERLLRLCPPHRNGRLVVSHSLCESARTRLERVPLLADSIAEAERLILRAEELSPNSDTVRRARERLEVVKKGRP